MATNNQRRSLLSSQARIQAPWVSVRLGDYVFGVKDRKNTKTMKNAAGFYVGPKNNINIKYFPDFVQSLNITKINGKVNTYTLSIVYPVTQHDDPNFFQKVLSSVSKTREIVFSYGDATQPNYVYKDQTALITAVTSTVQLESSTISYTITAVSNGLLAGSGCYSFPARKNIYPSQVIKELFNNQTYGLGSIFTGMDKSNLDQLIQSGDKPVDVNAKINISILDYITYLVSCMIPEGATQANLSKDIFILTIHDDTVYDKLYNDTLSKGGPYFKVTKTSYGTQHADAYVVDVGYNTSTLVGGLQIQNNQNYAILYDYQTKLTPQTQVQRLNPDGKWQTVYAPPATSNNDRYLTQAQDITWWTKITKFPITASIMIQGLLRPAHLMTYLRLNVIFPGGHKHISSGLYIITQQHDTIDQNGYKTQLKLTKIAGDPQLQT